MMPSSDTDTGFQSTPPISANSCGSSGMVMDLPSHPHHMNNVTHHGNVWNDVGTMPWMSAAWITGRWYGKMTRIVPGFQLYSQILIIKRCCKGIVMAPSVHPHHMNAVKQHFYVICAFRNHSPGKSTASTTAQWHGMMPSSDSGFQPATPICANSCSTIGMAMDWSAIHIIGMLSLTMAIAYVWNGCENHAMWVCSLNYSLMVWFDAQK